MAPTKPVLVVVGLGVAGSKVAKMAAANGKFQVVAIDPRNYHEVPFAAVRTAVLGDGAFVDRTIFPQSAVPGGYGKVIHGKVKAIKRNSVVLDSGDEVSFDYAVIATGSTHSGQGVVTSAAVTAEERKAELKASAKRIQKASSIVVVGGGPVGIEIVGEITSQYPGKKVTLVHHGQQLLEGKDPRLHAYFTNAMQHYKVELVLGDKASRWDEAGAVLHTVGGKQLAADLVIWAAGAQPNTQPFVEGGELAGAVDEKGRIKVDEYLRVDGASNIFALGDINNTPQAKLGYLAGLQADLTISNLNKVASGSSKLAKWVAPMQPKGAMFVTYGPQDGAGHIGGWVVKAWVLRMVKSKDLFVGKFRKDLGLSA